MRFTHGRKRQPPTIIIVSLIDILIVLLIFLMVTTTFRQTPAVRLALPESKEGEKAGASPDTLVVTVAKTAPYLYLNQLPVTFDRLQQELMSRARQSTNLSLHIRGDEGAPFGQIVKVMGAAKAARIRTAYAVTREPGHQ